MEYRNAKYINADGLIDCEINHPQFGWIPYTLDPNDSDTTIDNGELLASMTAAGDVSPYIAPTEDELYEIAAKNVRADRDARLVIEVDPMVTNSLRWAELSDDEKQSWADYRKLLLDIPQQGGFPHNVIWPTKP